MKKEQSGILQVPYVVYDTEMKRKQKLIYIIITCLFITILSIVIYSMLPTNDYTQQIQDINTIDNSTIQNGASIN